MVPGTDHYRRILRDGRRTHFRYPGEPRSQFLQPSQATRRLGQPEVQPSGLPDGGLADRRYLRHELQYPIFDGHD
jgi:hypothetical protein